MREDPRGAQFNGKDREIWNGIFSRVPPEWRSAPPSRAMIECREFLDRSKARTVLDLGCGIGRWAVYLAKSGFEVSGSDFAENGVRYADGWARDEGLRLRLTCCPVTRVPFPGERFDAVIATLVLDNVRHEEMRAALAIIHQSLVSGGAFFCLFNPPPGDEPDLGDQSDNPTREITQVRYEDRELRAAFAGFTLLHFRRYELGTRGLFLRSHRER